MPVHAPAQCSEAIKSNGIVSIVSNVLPHSFTDPDAALALSSLVRHLVTFKKMRELASKTQLVQHLVSLLEQGIARNKRIWQNTFMSLAIMTTTGVHIRRRRGKEGRRW